MGKRQTDADRLRYMVQSDACGALNDTLKVAQSDVMALLCEFMDVTRLDMRAEKSDVGYKLTVTADVARFYGVGRTDCE